MGTHQPPTDEQLARQRLANLDAFLLAAERRRELVDAVADANNPEAARESVAELFGITTPAAQALIEVRLRFFSQSEVTRVRKEREEIRGRLEEGR